MQLVSGMLLVTTLLCAASRLQGLFCLIPVWLFIPCSQILLDAQQFWLCLAVAICVLLPGRFSLRVGSLREALHPPSHEPAASLRS